MKTVGKTILGVILSLVLAVVIFIEVRYIGSIIKQRQDSLYFVTTALANSKAEALISIDKIYEYPELDMDVNPVIASENVDEETPIVRDVITFSRVDKNIKVRGSILDINEDTNNYYTYTGDDNKTYFIKLQAYSTGLSTLQEGILDYWNVGYYDKLLQAIAVPYSEESQIEQYQLSYAGMRYPVLYFGDSGTYYIFDDHETYVNVITSNQPIMFTNELLTAKFRDPEREVLRHHTYSNYETLASRNTLQKMLERDKETDTIVPDYSSDGAPGTSSTYTSNADDQLRKQMASYANYKWTTEGTAMGTSMRIDTGSDESKKSQWTLTQTKFSYTRAGLTVSNTSATVSSDTFEISCNINNNIDTERPFVMVFKLVGKDGTLLGLSVVDGRNTPLSSLGVRALRTIISKSDMNGSPMDVKGVQFEVY